MKKLFIIGLFFSLTGCATKGEFETLQNQVVTIAVTQKVLKDHILVLDKKMLELEKSTTNLNNMIETLNDEVSSMNSKLDRAFTKNILK